jgi:hypothetical protein
MRPTTRSLLALGFAGAIAVSFASASSAQVQGKPKTPPAQQGVPDFSKCSTTYVPGPTHSRSCSFTPTSCRCRVTGGFP